jgi:CRISPR-associated protein Csd2
MKRKDFLFLYDVCDGNPNGDPDAGNMPRIDPSTNQGIITDVALKRKIRNRVQIAKGTVDGYAIYVSEGAILNAKHTEAYERLKLPVPRKKTGSEKGSKDIEEAKGNKNNVALARAEMCKTYFDIRTFGAVMGTDIDCGQVRGPMQITFSRSVDPIVQAEHCITRMAVTTEEESRKQSGGNRTMGRKYTVPYGLYVGRGFLNVNFAEQTGFTEEDEAVFWDAFTNMFEDDRSSARGMMALRKLVIFEHDSPLGNAQAHKLFDRVTIVRNNGKEAMSYNDYSVSVDQDGLPKGVNIDVRD